MHRLAMSMALACAPIVGQEPSHVSGFARSISGRTLDYECALQEYETALLARTRESIRVVEWETAPVPEGDGDTVEFVWLFGMDTDVCERRFELAVGGETWLTFVTPAISRLESREFAADNGARLTLRTTYIDRAEDAMGFAFLEVPRRHVEPGTPLRLRVTGEDADSNIWYMTFCRAPAVEARVAAHDALLRRGDDLAQPITLELVSPRDGATATITTSFGEPVEAQLQLGLNRIELLHPEVREPVDEELSIAIDDAHFELPCTLRPVRRWTIHLVQHTHTDIGYTRPQTEILPDHLRYIDYALDFCDLTDELPDDARFRWTCEASWAVREFLRSRPPEQIARLARRVREGRIEVTAMYANLSELIDEAGCVASLAPLAELRAHGLPVTLAMQNDVNGFPWCFVDYLAELGVRYVSMGVNGHRALIPFDRPTPFWWESPGGRRVLALRADHYNTGNFWGVHAGNEATVPRTLFAYLHELAASGYPSDLVSVQYSGSLTDNSPPGTGACEFIARWNERYAWPRLRSATASEYFRAVEERHGDDLPVHRQAWPDWWSDGVATAPREVAAARRTQGAVAAIEGLLAISALRGVRIPEPLLRATTDIRERLIMYAEHTYGAAESISDPFCENSIVQWNQKAAFVWEAVKETALLEEKAFGLLQPRLARGPSPTITIVNPLGWPRSGMHVVFVDHEVLPRGRSFSIRDGQGRALAVQPLRTRTEGTWWGLWVEDVPPLGYRTYRIVLHDGAEPRFVTPRAEPDVLENQHYRVLIDPEAGGLASLFDKDLGIELLDPSCEWRGGQLIRELIADREQIHGRRLEDRELFGIGDLQNAESTDGPLWQSAVLTGSPESLPGQPGVRIEIRLHEREKRIELDYAIRKRRRLEPEGIYVAFPFGVPDARVRYETLGGLVAPDRDLLPRTSSDYQAVQSCAIVGSPDARVVLSSPDTLLMLFGGLHVGQYRETATVERPHVFSWVLNNYWVTNFRVSSEGELRWSYALTSGAPGEDHEAVRIGRSEQVPFLSRTMPPGADNGCPMEASLLQVGPDNVLLVGARLARDGRTVVLHLRETDGRATDVRIDGPLRPRRVDAVGDPIEGAPLEIPARGSIFVAL